MATSLFTVYRQRDGIEVRAGRDIAVQGQIYCSSPIYASALKIAKLLAIQYGLPYRDLTSMPIERDTFRFA
jgi:hypothetical protein